MKCGRKTLRNTVRAWGGCLGLAVLWLVGAGCGTTKSYTATEQLLMSDAVDSTISKIDFRPLAGRKLYLDPTYIATSGKPTPGVPMQQSSLVNADYVISGLRQQMLAAGCQLVENKTDADLIVEARCGALGTDGHSVIYGIPASNGLTGVGSILTGTPTIPAIPEISFAKRELKSAASNIAVFAYTRETREPVWQSGIAQAGSSARDTWFMGIGPWQYGTIYSGTRFAGKKIKGTEPIEVNTQIVDNQINGVDHRDGFIFVDMQHGATSSAFTQSAPPPPTSAQPAPTSASVPSTAQIPNATPVLR